MESLFVCVTFLVELTDMQKRQMSCEHQGTSSECYTPIRLLALPKPPSLAPSAVQCGSVARIIAQSSCLQCSYYICVCFSPQLEWKLLEMNYYRGFITWQSSQLLGGWGVCVWAWPHNFLPCIHLWHHPSGSTSCIAEGMDSYGLYPGN